MPRVIVLTGERGVGKTTICRETIALAQADGHDCGGILTLTRDGTRVVYDVGSGDARRLIQRPGAERAVIQGRFRFDPDALSWGSAVLTRSIPCDLLVIDEVGPLEVERDGGWVVAFDVLRGSGFALGLVVVRPELVVRAQLRLGGCSTTVVRATRENRDELPADLMDMLRRAT